MLSSRLALSNVVATHVVTEHLKCVPSVIEKPYCKFYFIFLKRSKKLNLNLKTDSWFNCRKLLSLFATTLRRCEKLFFSTGEFIKSKTKSGISDENLVSELRYTINIKYTLDFKDLV